jgi:hypothetical protein
MGFVPVGVDCLGVNPKGDSTNQTNPNRPVISSTALLWFIV